MKKILYISDLTEGDAIFHSQVVPHIAELRKHFEVVLLILTRMTKNSFDEHNIWYKSITGDYAYLVAKLNFLRQKKVLHQALMSMKYDLIYSRGIRGGILGHLINKHFYYKNILLLNDVRGDALDGAFRNFINRFVVHHANEVVFRNADVLFLVSKYLKDKICRSYKFNQLKAYVFPTFVPDDKFDFIEENRLRIRKEFDFMPDDVVVLYSGNLAKWQNLDIILSSFKRSSNSRLKMLFLTKDDEIEALLKKYDLWNSRVKVVNAPYEDIQKYYHAADFGILIRDNIDTNKSAAPTKFSEYVNAGLGLIINSIDADYIQTFREIKLAGVLLEKKEDLEDCLNQLSLSDISKNTIKINLLSELVIKQRRILEQNIDQNSYLL